MEFSTAGAERGTHTPMSAPIVTAAAGALVGARVKVAARDVNVSYGDKQALFDVSLDVPDRSVTAFIGPSGCGKTTFLRCINRMNDTIEGCRVSGSLQIDGKEAYGKDVDPVVLRTRVGMVFQKPNPFPKSIYENVAYGPRIHGMTKSKADMDVIVEKSLRRAGLWEEVKDRLCAIRHWALRRTTAASGYRPHRGSRSGRHLDGRAVLGA